MSNLIGRGLVDQTALGSAGGRGAGGRAHRPVAQQVGGHRDDLRPIVYERREFIRAQQGSRRGALQRRPVIAKGHMQ